MLIRVITGAVLAAVFVPIAIFSDTVVLPIVMAVLAAVAMGEMLHCVGLLRSYPLCISTIAVCGASPLLAYFLRDQKEWLLTILIFLITIVLFVILTAAIFSHGKVGVTDMSVVFLSFVYICIAFVSIVLQRHIAKGSVLFYLIFIGAWATDIFAYFSGYLFGKHKLIPDVSPKKTVEGAIGGTLCCALLFAGYAFILRALSVASISPLAIGLIGIVAAFVAQIGDLSMSLIKRHYGIKDYGKIFPGHGGVLDRFDSILATAPFVLFLSVILERFSLLG